MKTLIAFYRIIKFAFQNFWRNFWLSLITVSMLILTLLTVNVLVILNVVTATAITSVEEKIDVSVYFEPDTSLEIVQGAQGYLQGLPQVVDAKLITPDEALARFKERHVEDAEILKSLEEIEGNPFGASLVVKAKSPKDFDFILEALDNPQFRDYVEKKEFDDYEAIIQSINRVTDRVRLFGLALSGIFLLIAVLIVFNSIRVAIFIHKEEISIMRLVGASSWFIRAPFWVEVIMFSLLATIVSMVVTYPILGVLEPQFNSFFYPVETGLLAYYNANFLYLFGIQFIGLCIINIVASTVAMRQYLKT
ncbi:ABC transporter permease [Patescibacteria group bacterium]|nr:ABC transporter permease [Patescibacteria group bacterium]MBU1906844.1 ABC transporter permease [Patescibacteria group bacterium]